jgi:hypothetical protein
MSFPRDAAYCVRCAHRHESRADIRHHGTQEIGDSSRLKTSNIGGEPPRQVWCCLSKTLTRMTVFAYCHVYR